MQIYIPEKKANNQPNNRYLKKTITIGKEKLIIINKNQMLLFANN
jgi:hypothetical protein